MTRIFKLVICVLVVLFISACANESRALNARPDWIDNPGSGVSASAGTHIRGRAAQEELAILRGREEYAKRFGVSIQSVQTISTSVANDRASTVGSQVAHEDTRQGGIKAMVKAKWSDPDSDVLWVWLVPND